RIARRDPGRRCQCSWWDLTAYLPGRGARRSVPFRWAWAPPSLGGRKGTVAEKTDQRSNSSKPAVGLSCAAEAGSIERGHVDAFAHNRAGRGQLGDLARP